MDQMRTIYVFIGAATLLLIVFLITLPDREAVENDIGPAMSEIDTSQAAVEDEVEVVSRAPTFSVVRVDPTGETVIAGRALPGSAVTVMMGDVPIGNAEADARGEWVLIVEEPLTVGDQEIYLVSELPGGTVLRSDQKVAIAVPERRGQKPLVVLSEPGHASRVLQHASDAPEGLRLEAIDYDDSGNVIFSGYAEPHSSVSVYVDNEHAGNAVADADGFWGLEVSVRVAPGVHQLRVDELDENEKVVSRVELPFNRTAPELLLISEGQVVIQPGNNLWTIARYLYGSGFKYTVIFEANRDQIRDPDLIYPGQVFATPGMQDYR